MKKIAWIVLLACILLPTAEGQLFKYGIKAGVGFSSLRIDDLAITDGAEAYELVTGESAMGYHVGVQTQVKVAMVVIKPELYFNAGRGTIEQIEDGGVAAAMDVKFSRIDLPVLVGVKFGPLRVNAGPSGSYILTESLENEIAAIPNDYTVFTNSLTWGFQAGLGLDVSKLSLDVRYEGSLSQLGESFTVGGQTFPLDARPSQWIISLGIWL